MTRQVGQGEQRGGQAGPGWVPPGRDRGSDGSRRKKRDERGAALVEFSIVAVLLLTLIMGILVYGILLSKKQTVVQAANEAARAVVPMVYTSSSPGTQLTAIQNAAIAQLNTSLSSTNRSCSDTNGTTCTVTVNQCSTGSTTYCVNVTVTLDNKNHPIVLNIPLLSAFNPDTLTGQASAQLSSS